ncbi:MAG TPA: GLPGLI family protein [Saprospiraceae bacterium]|nr:GLPGLI family protein [Saprospiraceae bacterium]
MREFKILFFVNLFILNNICAQIIPFDFCITYEFNYLKDTNDVSSISNKTKLILFGNKEVVVFKPFHSYMMDSISFDYFGEAGFGQYTNSEDASIALHNLRDKTKSYTGRSWYPFSTICDLSKRETYTYYTSSQFVYATMENMNLGWEISEEVDSIGGFLVQKATTNFAGRKYEAWFTKEVAIPYGPYKFSGLPGLIIKLSDVDHKFNFLMTSIQGPSEKYFDKKWKRIGLKMEKSDFIKKLHDELQSKNPDVIEVIGESRSEKIEMAIEQSKVNSKQMFFRMELK